MARNVSRFLAPLLLLGAGSLLADDPTLPDQVRPLLIGATVPEVQVRTIDGAAHDLGSLLERKPTVLIFYRGGW